MLDAHVHIEAGPYTEEWIYRFVNAAISQDIDQLYLLEHSFRFEEFRATYQEIFHHREGGTVQSEWFTKKCSQRITDYQSLIDRMRKESLPIEVKFGLEVCYFPNQESRIKELVSDYDYDFLTGSIHWTHGWGFDQPQLSYLWDKQDVNQVYTDYYRLMIQLVESGLFSILAHPDSIKCMNYYPTADLTDQYRKLANALNKRQVAAEYSNGLRLNYGHHELGLNQILLKVFMENEVQIITASDAHRPEDVGKYIKESYQVLGYA